MFPIALEKYPIPEMDQIRVADIVRIVPKVGGTALDVGALWGYFSEYLTNHYEHVTALDLVKPAWELPRVTTVAGDITRLQFPDNAFDCVFCAEVLEHIPDLAKAVSELARVARKYILVGVPFEQDLRVGRLTCTRCGKVNPPYGHVNSFTEAKIKGLFPAFSVETTSFVLPQRRQRTNRFSAWLLDLARNPYGDYDRLEPCMFCNQNVGRPAKRTLFEKGCSFAAYRINRLQNVFSPERAGWIHVVFRKK